MSFHCPLLLAIIFTQFTLVLAGLIGLPDPNQLV